jgi:hypothetical protein
MYFSPIRQLSCVFFALLAPIGSASGVRLLGERGGDSSSSGSCDSVVTSTSSVASVGPDINCGGIFTVWVVIVALALGGRSSDGGFRAVTMVDGDGALDRHSRAACSHPTSVFSMLCSRVLYATQTAYAMHTQTGTILPEGCKVQS